MQMILVFAIAVTSALQSHIGGNVTVHLKTRLVRNVLVGPQTLLIVSNDFLAVRADAKGACRPVFIAPAIVEAYEPLAKPRFTGAAPLASLFRGPVPTKWTSLFVNGRFTYDIYDRDGYLICRACSMRAPSAAGVFVDMMDVGAKTATKPPRPRYIRYDDIGAVEYNARC